MSEEGNRKCPAKNTTIQLSTLCTDPERHSAQLHRETDRRTTSIKLRAERSDKRLTFWHWVAVRQYDSPAWQLNAIACMSTHGVQRG